MIVRCVATTGEALPLTARDPAQGVSADTEFALTLEDEYEVFAVTVFLGTTWYYVMDDDGNPWPTWVPAALFDVEDGSISPTWCLGYFRFGRDDQYPILSFPEWAHDHQFYERLVDGDAAAVATFERRRLELMRLTHGDSA
ncbi:hypothetical protein SAMN05421595_0693 [Austwickia chelonae]|uniref:Uncharacterized protein n=1 Tax=Austwickia chelonae NBRC 105200 TaxID=1184607 RepID=K6W8M4_9MICO|nr:hypothetical protein AUCHE_08_04170 [Austwickia chelonae NBRC 105200]SEV98176.1 hypothetical protein SAMN05421595_0693 [Austwickia chelonae]